MARRSEHSQDELKEMILTAAETIVDEEGFAALKVRTVASEIGYTVGTIYMIFANMDDLIIQLKTRSLDRLNDQLQQVMDHDPIQHIRKLAYAYLAFAEQYTHRWSLIFEQPVDDEIPEGYQHKINDVFSNLEQPFLKLTQRHTPEQSRQAARTLWSGIHGICILALSGKMGVIGLDNIQNSIDLLVDHFLAGWMIPPVDQSVSAG
jgi:AcrR family transcriptional regulator